MNSLIKCLFLVLSIAELVACTIGNGHICGPQTPAFYCDKDAYDKLMHTKSYGEDWTKPSATKEDWRQDWVGCGGMSDGDWANDAPKGATTREILAASERIITKINACMKSRGYTYQYTGPFTSSKSGKN